MLSRIAAAGVDYSRRSNKLAHHVVLLGNEAPPSGPAWLLQQPGFMVSQWDGQVRLLPAGRPVPVDPGPMGPPLCPGWQQAAGDAGWAGILAETALSGQQAVLIVPVGMDPLPLVAEALQLLPPEYRWKVTFTTYYTGLPSGIDCQWRCVIQGTPEELPARRTRGALVLDLTNPMGPAPDSAASQAAREGRPIPTPAPEPALAPGAAPGATPPLVGEAVGQPMAPPQTPLPQATLISSGGTAEPVLGPLPGAPLPPAVPPPPTVIIHGFRRKRRWWPWVVGGLATALALLLAIGIPLLVRMAQPLAEQPVVAQGPGDAGSTAVQTGTPSGQPASEKPEAKDHPPPKTSNGDPHSQGQPGHPADQSSAPKPPSSPPNEKEKKEKEDKKEDTAKVSPTTSPEPTPPESSKPGDSGEPKPPGTSPPSSAQQTTPSDKPSDKPADPFQEGPKQPSEKKPSKTTPGPEQPPQEKPSEKPFGPGEAPKEKPSETQPGQQEPSKTPPPGPSTPSQPQEPPLILVKPERRWLSIPSHGDVVQPAPLKIDVLGKGGRTVDSLQLELLIPEEFKPEIREKYSSNPLDTPSKIQIVCQSPTGVQEPFAEVILEKDEIRFQWTTPKQWETRSEILEECLLLVKDTKHRTCLAIIQFRKPSPAGKKQDSSLKRGDPWPPLDRNRVGITFSTKIPQEKIMLEAVLGDGKEPTCGQDTGKPEWTFEKDKVRLQVFLEKTDQNLQCQGILTILTSPRLKSPPKESLPNLHRRLNTLISNSINEINKNQDRIIQLQQKLNARRNPLEDNLKKEIEKLNNDKERLENEKAGYESLKQILESSKVRYRIYHTVKDSQGREYRVYIGFSEGMEPKEE